MTDLKQLLDDAAGPEPTVTDTDLSTDLTRGRRALRRRRATGIASGAVATALVIGVGWSVLPSGTTNGAPDPAQHTTPTPTKAGTTPKKYVSPQTKRPVPPGQRDDPRPPARIIAGSGALVANHTPFPGSITCDLVPKGWAVRTRGAEQELYDPKLKDPGQYRALTYTLVLRPSEMLPRPGGLGIDRVADESWARLKTWHAGKNEAAVFVIPDSEGKTANPYREVYVRQGQSTHMIVATNYAWSLSWDMFTLLKFAGSCHYK